MDTFGRLPNEIINKITSLVALPEIEILCGLKYEYRLWRQPQSLDLTFRIKYQSLLLDLEMVSKIKCRRTKKYTHDKKYTYDKNHNEILIKFINDLKINIDCKYDISIVDEYEDNQTFVIEFKDNKITICTMEAKLNLTIESKDQLISAMQKYYELLNSFPEH